MVVDNWEIRFPKIAVQLCIVALIAELLLLKRGKRAANHKDIILM